MLAEGRGLTSTADVTRGIALMRGIGLPIYHPICSAGFLAHGLSDTVKHRDGHQRLPLTNGIGSAVFVNDVTEEELALAVRKLATNHHGELDLTG